MQGSWSQRATVALLDEHKACRGWIAAPGDSWSIEGQEARDRAYLARLERGLRYLAHRGARRPVDCSICRRRHGSEITHPCE